VGSYGQTASKGERHPRLKLSSGMLRRGVVDTDVSNVLIACIIRAMTLMMQAVSTSNSG
jgi:hypothetical protein